GPERYSGRDPHRYRIRGPAGRRGPREARRGGRERPRRVGPLARVVRRAGRRLPRERAAEGRDGPRVGRGGNRLAVARHRRRPRPFDLHRALRRLGRLPDPLHKVRRHDRSGRRGRSRDHQGERMTANTAQLAAAGVSIWLDDLSRDRITTGNLAELIETRSVSGVTTNPTIFAGALSNGASYADAVAELSSANASTDEAIFTITSKDVQDACDIFRPVYDATNGVDGRVSIEVSPDLAHDTEGTIAQAKDLWARVDREN